MEVVLVLGFIVVATLELVRLRPKPVSRIDEAIEAKLASIAEGEPRGTEALLQICLSRSTPDEQRARALRMLAELADPATFGRAVTSVARACGRETCIAIFELADRYPDPLALERAARNVLRGSDDIGVRHAAIDALAVIDERRERARGALSETVPNGGELSLTGTSDRRSRR